jgi:hypothetical protein
MIQLVETTDESLFLLVADHIATLLNEVTAGCGAPPFASQPPAF